MAGKKKRGRGRNSESKSLRRSESTDFGDWINIWHGVKVMAPVGVDEAPKKFFDVDLNDRSPGFFSQFYQFPREHIFPKPRAIHNPRQQYKDMLYVLLNMRWPMLSLFLGTAYFSVIILFGLLLQGCGEDLVFTEAFNLSFHTFSTIGYGYLFPRTRCGNYIMIIECFSSMIGMSLLTGLVFAKFARPRAKIAFGKVCVIQPYGDRHLALVIRAANATESSDIRHDVIMEASFKVNLLRIEKQLICTNRLEEEQLVLCNYNLDLVQKDFITFRMGVALVHIIDDKSPFAGMTHEHLVHSDMVLQVVMSGVDSTIQDTVSERWYYTGNEFRWGNKFVEMLEFCEETGRIVMDFSKLGTTEPAPFNEYQYVHSKAAINISPRLNSLQRSQRGRGTESGSSDDEQKTAMKNRLLRAQSIGSTTTRVSFDHMPGSVFTNFINSEHPATNSELSQISSTDSNSEDTQKTDVSHAKIWVDTHSGDETQEEEKIKEEEEEDVAISIASRIPIPNGGAMLNEICLSSECDSPPLELTSPEFSESAGANIMMEEEEKSPDYHQRVQSAFKPLSSPSSRSYTENASQMLKRPVAYQRSNSYGLEPLFEPLIQHPMGVTEPSGENNILQGLKKGIGLRTSASANAKNSKAYVPPSSPRETKLSPTKSKSLGSPKNPRAIPHNTTEISAAQMEHIQDELTGKRAASLREEDLEPWKQTQNFPNKQVGSEVNEPVLSSYGADMGREETSAHFSDEGRSASSVENGTAYIPKFLNIQPLNIPKQMSVLHFYCKALHMKWIPIFTMFVVSFGVIHVVFALLYWVEAENGFAISDSLDDMTLFEHSLFFSVHTLSTVGYGSISPISNYNHFFVTVQGAFGMTFVTIFTGICWAKFAKPRAHILFSKNILITRLYGHRCLVFRAANTRHIGDIRESLFRVGVLLTNTRTGLRQLYDLNLVTPSWPSLALSTTLIHVIDENSPFFKITSVEDLAHFRVSVISLFTGLDTTFNESVYARKMYFWRDFQFHMHFRDNILLTPNGLTIDFSTFNELLPDGIDNHDELSPAYSTSYNENINSPVPNVGIYA